MARDTVLVSGGQRVMGRCMGMVEERWMQFVVRGRCRGGKDQGDFGRWIGSAQFMSAAMSGLVYK